MAGLIHLIRSGKIGKSDEVLFWHTGGAPALFAYADNLDFSGSDTDIYIDSQTLLESPDIHPRASFYGCHSTAIYALSH